MTQHELSAEALEQQKSDAEARRLAAERAAYYVLHGGPRPEGFVLPRLGREVPWPDEAGQGPPERMVSLLRAGGPVQRSVRHARTNVGKKR